MSNNYKHRQTFLSIYKLDKYLEGIPSSITVNCNVSDLICLSLKKKENKTETPLKAAE